MIVQITREGLESGDEHESERYWKEIQSTFGVDNNSTPEEMLDDFNMWMKDPDIQDRLVRKP